jgi:multicomponent Na+:H+ antiporter subunit C
MNSYLPYLLCFVLFCIGIYAVLSKKNLIKIIVGLAISEYAANLFLILVGYRLGGRAPIYSPTETIQPGQMVDPLPQALVLTSIVIGLAITAFLVAIAMRLYEKYGTFDVTKIRELRG